MHFKKSLKPYLLNAFYTWSLDLGFTPLIEVKYNPNNILPIDMKKNDTLFLNIHHNATRNLVFGKDTIEFQAKFDGISSEISISHESISKVFNKEDNYGIDFDIEPSIEELKNTKPKLRLVKNEDN